jgi:hypothetical protein
MQEKSRCDTTTTQRRAKNPNDEPNLQASKREETKMSMLTEKKGHSF